MDTKEVQKGWVITLIFENDPQDQYSHEIKHYYFMKLENAKKFQREKQYDWLNECGKWDNLLEERGDEDFPYSLLEYFENEKVKTLVKTVDEFYAELDKRSKCAPKYINWLIEEMWQYQSQSKYDKEGWFNFIYEIEKIKFEDS